MRIVAWYWYVNCRRYDDLRFDCDSKIKFVCFRNYITEYYDDAYYNDDHTNYMSSIHPRLLTYHDVLASVETFVVFISEITEI